MTTSLPTATYRLQLTSDFTLFDAAAVVPYLAELGVSHVYCSPWLTAAPGSRHGYDVVDHSRVNPELGGDAGVAALRTACDEHGLGIVLDLVPNHMHVGAPEQANAAWWDVLRHGKKSSFASWFDIDWSAGPVRIPVLGSPDETAEPDPDDAALVRYGDHRYPADGEYELGYWREGPSYRRFFDVDSLAGVRVEDPEVFAATHAVVARQVAAGTIQGIRIDHPDGLSDPAGYLDQLDAISDDCWVVVEKVLEPGEMLPDWKCSGTTGYESLTAITRLMTDPEGEVPLRSLAAAFSGNATSWEDECRRAKKLVARDIFRPEVRRLVELAAPSIPGASPEDLADAFRLLLADGTVYRSYVRPGEPIPAAAQDQLTDLGARAGAERPDLAGTIDRIVELVAGAGSAELVVRFQQTAGPVMAKGVEDTASYRYLPLVALNEVGGDPGTFGMSLAEWHESCVHLQSSRPAGMTTLSTHDTKRSEDVRARLLLLAEDPDGWAPLAHSLVDAAVAQGLDPGTSYLLAQTLVGAWPITGDRLADYLTKATKEAKQHTSWIDPVSTFDDTVRNVARAMVADQLVSAAVSAWLLERREADLCASLSSKLVQLFMPGIPDCYQGCETVDRSLVDPDNRRDVDFSSLISSLGSEEDAKQHLVTTALRLRRRLPDAVGPAGAYVPLELGNDDWVGFTRGDAITVLAPRRPLAVSRGGRPAPPLPLDGDWTDLLPRYPVRLLVRSELLQDSVTP